MKTKKQTLTIFVLLFILISKNIFGQVPPPESNPHRGLYVDNFYTVNNNTGLLMTSFSILDNQQREDSLLKFAMIHHITQLNLYDLRFIIGNAVLQTKLCAFIDKARNNYCIDQIGVIVEDPALLNNIAMTPAYIFSAAQLNSPYFDNSLLFLQNTILPTDPLFGWAEALKFLLNATSLVCTSGSAFNVYNLEYEFWNTGTPQADYTNTFLPRLAQLKTIQMMQNSSAITEVYLNRMNQFSTPEIMAAEIEGTQSNPANADRILMTHYKSYMDSSTYDNVNKYYIYSDDPTLNTTTSSVRKRVTGFRDATTRDHTDWHPLYSAESIYNSGDGNFTGNWLGRTSRFNIFSADMRYFDQWRNDNVTNITTNSENNVQIGGSIWFSSFFLQKDLFNSLPYNKAVVPRPILFETNSPVCTSGGSGIVKFEYMGPLEVGINYDFSILDNNCQDVIATISSTSLAYTPPTTINNSPPSRVLSITLPNQTLPVGEYKAILTLHYTPSCSYSYEQPIIISSGQPKIVALGATKFCDGGSVVLRGPATSSITWYKVGNPDPIANIYTGESSWINSGHRWELTVRESGFYYACVGSCTASSCQGKTNIIEVIVDNNPPPVITTDCNTSGGSSPIILHAPSGQSYLWTDGSTTQQINVSYSHLRESYWVNVTQSNGCQRMAKVYINPTMFSSTTLSPSITATPATPLSCPEEVVLQAAFPASTCSQCALNRYPNSSVAWSNGFSGTDNIHVNPTSSSTTYSVWLKDDNGCISKTDYTIAITNTATASNTPTIPDPCGNGNTILLNSSGGSAYSWNGPSSYTSSSQNPTIANADYQRTGVYTVSVTNASCPSPLEAATTVAGIFNPPVATVNPSGSIDICSGNNVTLTANNSCGTYLWSNGAITQPITVSTSGNYSVTITDANGCTGTSASVSVTVNPLPTFTIQSTDISCNGANDGTITINVTTGTAPFSYSLTGGAPYTTFVGSTVTLTSLSASTSQVRIIDSHGCESTITNVTINEPTAVQITNVTTTPANCNDGVALGNIVVSATGGTGTLHYSDGGAYQTGNSFNEIFGQYNISVHDDNGCTVNYSGNPAQVETPFVCNGGTCHQDICSPTTSTTLGITSFSLGCTIAIHANLIIDNSFTINGNEILIDPNVTITIASGSDLTIQNAAYLHACTDLWQGIVLTDNTSQLNVTTDSRIEDAENATYADNGGIIQIDNAHYDHNWISISLSNADYSSSSITNSTFICTGEVITKAPHANYQPRAQIQLDEVTYFKLGVDQNSMNTIGNATYGVWAHNSNLDVMGNNFDYVCTCTGKIRLCTAIYATSDYYLWYNPGPEFTLNVGGDNPLNNDFHFWGSGIYTDRMHYISVDQNNFDHCQNTASFSEGRELTVTNNRIDIFRQGINCYNYFPFPIYQIGAHPVFIDNNIFNSILTYDPLTYGYSAINIQNSYLHLFAPFTISNNSINECTIGIHLRNIEGGFVGDLNTYTTDIPETEFKFPHYGIWLENCSGTQVQNNDISWTGTSATLDLLLPWLKGIGIAKSHKCNLRDNHIVNMAAGVNVLEDCSNSNLYCNWMELCYHGVYFDGNGVGNKLTDQGGNGFMTGPGAWKNQWISNVSTTDRIGGNLAAFWTFLWYYTFPATYVPVTTVSGVIPQLVTNEVQFCDMPHFLDDQRREHAFGDAVNDSTINDPDSTEFIYYDKEEFYKQAMQDSTILNLGTANDIKYQQAFDSLSQTNIGKYEAVKEHLLNNERQLAIQQLSLIIDENLKEQNLKYISSLIAINYTPYLDADSDTIAVVTYIANQHPFYGGEAVYMARAILHIDVIDQFPALRRAHIQQNNPPSLIPNIGILFPNPTNDKVTFSYAHDEKTEILITVKSTIGSKLLSYKVIGNELIFSTSLLSQGMYFITVYENGIEKETHRLAVIH